MSFWVSWNKTRTRSKQSFDPPKMKGCLCLEHGHACLCVCVYLSICVLSQCLQGFLQQSLLLHQVGAEALCTAQTLPACVQLTLQLHQLQAHTGHALCYHGTQSLRSQTQWECAVQAGTCLPYHYHTITHHSWPPFYWDSVTVKLKCLFLNFNLQK